MSLIDDLLSYLKQAPEQQQAFRENRPVQWLDDGEPQRGNPLTELDMTGPRGPRDVAQATDSERAPVNHAPVDVPMADKWDQWTRREERDDGNFGPRSIGSPAAPRDYGSRFNEMDLQTGEGDWSSLLAGGGTPIGGGAWSEPIGGSQARWRQGDDEPPPDENGDHVYMATQYVKPGEAWNWRGPGRDPWSR